MATARQLGVVAFNAPEGNRNAVAEHALGLLLGMMNKQFVAAKETEEMIWRREPHRGEELYGKTVALLGYGNTARSLARLLSGFSVKLLACDKYLNGFSNELVTEASMDEIFDQAQYIQRPFTLNPRNRSFDRPRIFETAPRKPIYLINTSRGKTLPLKDLLEAINQGIVESTSLDVLPNERPNTFTTEEKSVYKALWRKREK